MKRRERSCSKEHENDKEDITKKRTKKGKDIEQILEKDLEGVKTRERVQKRCRYSADAGIEREDALRGARDNGSKLCR